MRSSRLLAGTAIVLFTAGLALAQTTPNPSPSPPQDSRITPPDELGPPPPPQTFHSPYNGDRQADGAEGKDYAKLQDAYDFWQDEIAAVAKAKLCGDWYDYQRALDLEARAEKEFNDLLNQYVIDWSTFDYGQKTPPKSGTFGASHMDDHYKKDKQDALDELKKHYVPFGQPICPKTVPGVRGPIPPKPDRPDDPLGGLLGHVTIGVGVGGDDHHHDDRGRHDDRHDDRDR